MVFRLGIFGVLVAALVAVLVFAYSLVGHPKPPPVAAAPPPPPSEQILVAAKPLQAGVLLQPVDINTIHVLVSAAPAGAIVDSPANRASLMGALVRTQIAAGMPLRDDWLIHPGDHGFLAAVLAPGMRAVTVAVSAVTSSNGLIWPGDTVDVLLTQTIAGAPYARSIAAETVLSDVRVIATGAELAKNPAAGPSGGGATSTVTLEVTPEQAARCIVASHLGTLTLIVHSAQGAATKTKGKAPPAPLKPVWAGDVSPAYANAKPASPQVSTVNVISSGGSGEFKF